MKKTMFMSVAILAVMLTLCACQSTSQSNSSPDSSLQSNNISSGLIDQDPDHSSAATKPNISWGTSSDILKKYEDHNGDKNQYRDYIMTLTYSGNDVEATVLLGEGLGSNFLTSTQNFTATEPQLPPPENSVIMKLSVTDMGIECIYFFYENGAIYTIQNDKWYYLGAEPNAFEFAYMSSTFNYTSQYIIPVENYPLINIPPFDPFNDNTSDFTGGEDKLKDKIKYDANLFEVCIEWTNYGEPNTPILIQNTKSKEELYEIINGIDKLESSELFMGAGPIIRIFDSETCYNYRIYGDSLLDYTNNISLLIPDDTLFDCCRNVSTYELANLLQELS